MVALYIKQDSELLSRRDLLFVFGAFPAVYRRVAESRALVEHIAAEHAFIFAGRLRELFGEGAVINDAGIDDTLTVMQAQWIQTLERLLAEFERQITGRAPGGRREDATRISLLDGVKKINPAQEIAPQAEERLNREQARFVIRLSQKLDHHRQLNAGIRRYIWRSRDDGRVRDGHRDYDDRIFSWDDPPPDGHPGEAFGCRCIAEPVADNAEPGVQIAVAPLVIPGAAASLAAAARILARMSARRAAALRMAESAGRSLPVLQDLPDLPEDNTEEEESPQNTPSPEGGEDPENTPERVPDEELFRRPDGVPEDWEREVTKDKKGVIFIKPRSARGTYVKIKRGDPRSSMPGQRRDNVRIQINGQNKDKFGNNVPKQSSESHIPWEEFIFDSRFLK